MAGSGPEAREPRSRGRRAAEPDDEPTVVDDQEWPNGWASSWSAGAADPWSQPGREDWMAGRPGAAGQPEPGGPVAAGGPATADPAPYGGYSPPSPGGPARPRVEPTSGAGYPPVPGGEPQPGSPAGRPGSGPRPVTAPPGFTPAGAEARYSQPEPYQPASTGSESDGYPVEPGRSGGAEPAADRGGRPGYPRPVDRPRLAPVGEPPVYRPEVEQSAYRDDRDDPAYQADDRYSRQPQYGSGGYRTDPDDRYARPESSRSSARWADPVPEALPQRVPAEPDVPTVPEPPAVDPPAETPELARIATHLRREDAATQDREGFDVNAILTAVRGVAGVRDAALRTTPAGAHSLRLDLADGADPAEVSRVVARVLQEQMGLAAAPQNLSEAASTTTPAAEAAAVPHIPRQAQPDARSEGRRSAEPAAPGDVPGRRRQATAHQGRAAVAERTDDQGAGSGSGTGADGPSGLARLTRTAPGLAGSETGGPVTASTYSGGQQLSNTESAPSRPLNPGGPPGPRVVIDHVQVSTIGLDATVEVQLGAGDRRTTGVSTGPAVDGYVLRLCAASAAIAVDALLQSADRPSEQGRCFVEHAAVVPFGNCEVATVVVLLVCDGWVEQLAGSALVSGDPRQAVVRATLAAVNRRLEALLA
ncbi:DNA polymerase III subunit gamma/tau domain-containing protein [Micromonospora zhanjiangensis]